MLSHPDPAQMMGFARWMGASPGRLVIADDLAVEGPTNVFGGRAYCYERVAGTWSLVQTLRSTAPGGESVFFGRDGDLEGDRLVLIEFDEGLGNGSDGTYRVFDHNGHEFVESARLMSPGPDPAWQFSVPAPIFGPVTVGGNRIVGRTSFDQLLIWKEHPSGWILEQRLDPPPVSPVTAYGHGDSVDLEGEWLVASRDPNSNLHGRVEVYRFEPASGRFEHHQTLRARDADPGNGLYADGFGDSLALRDGVLVIGATVALNAIGSNGGQVFVFEVGPSGNWVPTRRLTSTSAELDGAIARVGLGAEVSVTDGLVTATELAGFVTDPAIRSGRVAVFELPIGRRLCDGDGNSVSAQGAALEVLGRREASYGLWPLRGSSLPPGALVLPLASRTTGSTTVLQGTLCLGGSIHRLGSAVGMASARGDFESLVASGAVANEPLIDAGSTWHFQLWYRDVHPLPTANLSSAVSVMFR
ncbi:MAG: hypothetical protein AAF957_29460 [Planctomycetota bacterium]